MDFALVMKELGVFFMDYCSTELVFNGYRFTVGSVYLFCAFALVIIAFLKGMSK